MTSPQDRYESVRVEEFKTVGDAYREVQRDPTAFLAGAQYALDKVVHGVVGVGPLDDFINTLAAEILRRAKLGEPQ